MGGEPPILRNAAPGTGEQARPPRLFVLFVCLFLINDLRQFQRLDAGHFEITVALQTRYEFAFFEFIFADINVTLALRAFNYHYSLLPKFWNMARCLALILGVLWRIVKDDHTICCHDAIVDNRPSNSAPLSFCYI